jgi:nucleotide-binding universal stress UspA family protein
MYRRIAVPLDGTVASHQAIPWAVAIAREANCPIELIHVAFPPVVGAELYAAAVQHPDDIEAVRQTAQRDLQSLADQLASRGIASTATVLIGEVPHALIDHLEPSDADLVIMTTHDASRLERLLIGSVSESVIRHLHVPVLLIRQDETTPDVEAPRSITRMLIPLDGSPFGDEILPHAAKLATLMSSEVTLVGVLQPVLAIAAIAADVGGPNAALIPIKTSEENPVAEQTAAEALVLEKAASPLRSNGMTVHTTVLVDGQPAHAIVDYAEHHAIEAIAMTTHGRGAIKRFLAGSVSRRVLRTSHVPVLMYRPATA